MLSLQFTRQGAVRKLKFEIYPETGRSEAHEVSVFALGEGYWDYLYYFMGCGFGDLLLFTFVVIFQILIVFIYIFHGFLPDFMLMNSCDKFEIVG